MKITRRRVNHGPQVRSQYGFVSHWTYDWETDLFWGSVSADDGPAEQQARLENARMMSHPGYRKSAKWLISPERARRIAALTYRPEGPDLE